MLLQRPEPFTDETLESYLIRVGMMNGYREPDKFLSVLKRFLYSKSPSLFQPFPQSLSTFNPCHANLDSASRLHTIRELSQLVFKEPVSLQRLLLNRTSGKFSPNSTALIRHDEMIPRALLRSRPTFCPTCLKETGYARYWWHFQGYLSCHIHNTELIDTCHNCGEPIDYRNSGLLQTCPVCEKLLNANTSDSSCVAISSWLAGNNVSPLPDLEKSYRWGIVHWWQQNHGTIDSAEFITYWKTWPLNYRRTLSSHIEDQFEFAPDEPQQLTAKYVLGDYLFNCALLPDRNLNHNILLRETISYLDDHLWDDDGRLANLRVSALDIALILGTSPEQVVALHEQRLLRPINMFASPKPPKITAPVFALGDAFCLWVTDFQTSSFNRSTYVSRW